jgi:ATP-dependent RNA helicase DHX57
MPLDLLALHGGLQPRDQNKVFNRAPPGRTKVILSTNIAETSITIPDCTTVIDSCREKQSSYDPVNRMPLLLEHFAAKSSLKQRRGRAGRVQAGTCYKLISRATHDGLPEHGTPEIHRCALDQTLLSLLFLGVENGSGNFFQTLLDPPNHAAVDSATLSLQKLGAITPPDVDNQVSLTPLGIHLACIPAPPPVGKIMILGSILGCRSAALAMAAGMSAGRTPFIRVENFSRRGIEMGDTIEDMKRQRTIEARKDLFRTVGNSDHAMLAAAYLQWDSSVGPERRSYCDLMGLNLNGMNDIKQLVNQLHLSLATAGYDATEESDRNSRSWRIIRACCVAALAPSQLVRVHRPSAKYAETIGGAKERMARPGSLRFSFKPHAMTRGPIPVIVKQTDRIARQCIIIME